MINLSELKSFCTTSSTNNPPPATSITVPTGKAVHIGFDTEYEYNDKAGSNHILSYQFYLVTDDGSCSFSHLIYTKDGQKKSRLRMDQAFGEVIHRALQARIIDEWPARVFVYAHFLRADIASFSDFWGNKTQVNGIRGTIASLKGAYGIDIEEIASRSARNDTLVLRDIHRKAHRVSFCFIDTLLITPGGQGLADVGKMLGLPKLTIPAPYSISRMREYLSGDPQGFANYALRDAEIAVRYGLAFREFIREELGHSKLPPTIGSCAVSVFSRNLAESHLDIDSCFAYCTEESAFWNKTTARQTFYRRRVPSPLRHRFETLATDCYHGGRNECYTVGPSPVGDWYDFDLSGAYTTGLVDIMVPDYARAFSTQDVHDFTDHVLGYAYVRFRFPPTTRFPCLPVRTERYGLVFPLSGESYCTAPEIAVAIALGADIDILYGAIIPWADGDTRLFQSFTSLVRTRRRAFPRKSLKELLWKEIGNSLYGKLAQGLREKNAFDVAKGVSRKLPPSRITQPYYAAHATGFVRAVMAECLNGIPANKTVISATTDGFLTNATLNEIPLNGPLCSRYQALCNMMSDSGSSPMLELKHKAGQIIAMKTRGQLTSLASEGSEPVMARAGVSVPAGMPDPQAWMVELYLHRQPGQKMDNSHLISLRQMWLKESDLISVQKQITLNLEFDFKRQPCMPTMQVVSGQDMLHLSLKTRPWETVEQMMQTRSFFDEFREKRCLKNLEDYAAWEEMSLLRVCLKGSSLRNTGGTAADLLLRMFLRALTQKQWGLNGNPHSYNDIVGWLNGEGYPVTLSDIKNAIRSKLIPGVVPLTSSSHSLLTILLQRYPDFEWQHCLHPRFTHNHEQKYLVEPPNIPGA
ncbi:hypothetical protein O1Y80_000796 [Yersinia enterocolitica]|nr:hypothetical protein [Yersinia enterocolitica]EKN3831206.1 hypothetical protein [Yersinia enterocolitica]